MLIQEHLVFILLIAAAALLTGLVAFLRRAARRRRLPYFSRGSLLTNCELKFYQTLRKALPEGTTLCMQVRLCDLIDCPREARANGFWGKIAQKHIDFVIADAATTAILLAIELDDRSHQRKDRRERDAFVDAALDVAGIPILHVPTAPAYDARALRTQIIEKIRRSAPGRAA